MWQSKNCMEILKRENLMLFPADPFFFLQKLSLRTMPVTAGMEDLYCMTALFADFDSPTQFLCPARLDGRYNLSFMA